MEKYLPYFTEEILKRISAATFADRVAFTETLLRHKEDFSSLLQYMADCYKALFADKSSCANVSVAITHLVSCGQTRSGIAQAPAKGSGSIDYYLNYATVV